MRIEYYYPRWGSEHVEWDLFLKKIKDADYNGVEYALPSNTTAESLQQVCEKVKAHDLKLILQHYDTNESNYSAHYLKYKNWLELVKPFDFVKINSQTGRDFFSFDENNELLELAQTFTSVNQIEICHETHRSKFSYACHVTAPFLIKNPDLKITLDVSHWVTVAESFLEDQKDAIKLALSRTEHIHARVGHTQGPQVIHTKSPEWREALDHHLFWWDEIIQRKKLTNDEVLTITTEFGPVPYMATNPVTLNPMASQWEMNCHIQKLLKKRYD